MKRLVRLACLLLAGCSGSHEPMNEAELSKLDAELAQENRAEAQATSDLKQVKYPDCAVVWKDNKVTACGKAVFKVAMRECRGRALNWSSAHGTPTLIDEYTGDGWQQAAGSTSVKDDDGRIKFMEQIESQSIMEPVAAALGNGTSNIQEYYCNLTNFRLDGILKGRLIKMP